MLMLSVAAMTVLGAVLVQQLSVLLLSGELPKNTLSGFRTPGGYTLGAVKFGSVMQLRLLRPKDFITGLLCTEGMLIIIAVMCVQSTSDLLRYGWAANALSRGAKRSSLFAAVCISNIIRTALAAAVSLVSFVLFTKLPASGFSAGAAADMEDLGVILRQLTELSAFAAMCTAAALLLKKPLTSALTLISGVLVLPSVLSYMRVMYGTDLGLSKAVSFVRLLESGLLLPNAGDAAAAAGMLAASAVAGVFLMNKARPEL